LLFVASFPTSSATTLNPFPVDPILAASTPALNDTILVSSAIRAISSVSLIEFSTPSLTDSTNSSSFPNIFPVITF